MTWKHLTTAETLEIEQLLRAGHSLQEVHRRTGRSTATVRNVRIALGLPAFGSGRGPRQDPPMVLAQPRNVLDGERPHQGRWLELLHTANPAQLKRMQRAVCRVLGLSVFATGETLASAAIADRRTADELAAAYLVEIGLREAA